MYEYYFDVIISKSLMVKRITTLMFDVTVEIPKTAILLTHWSVEMDESADQIFSKSLREFLKDT